MEISTIQEKVGVIADGQKKAKTSIKEARNFYSDELRELLCELKDISKLINILEMVTPTNYIKARDDWMAAARNESFTEPRFVYNKDLLTKISYMRPQFQALQEKLDEWLFPRLEDKRTPPEEAVLLRLFVKRMSAIGDALELGNRMLNLRDNYTLSTVIIDIYGVPETYDEALAFAKELQRGGGVNFSKDLSHIQTGENLKKISVNAEGIRKAFLWAATQCGFGATRPVIIEAASSIDVRDTSSIGPEVVIPEDRQVNGLKLLELVGHEILAHWRDSENTQDLLPYFGGGAIKAYDEVLYEGHALAYDYRTQIKYRGEAARMMRPYYVIAETLAIHDGFSFPMLAHDIYHMILPENPTEERLEKTLTETWKTCYRTFRGSSGYNDKLHSYAFTKDRAYFEGRILANELEKAGLGHLLNLGTLSLDDLVEIAQVFKIEKDDFEYPDPENLLEELADKIIAGDFTAVQ